MAGLDPAIHFEVLRGGKMDGRLGLYAAATNRYARWPAMTGY